MADLRRYVFLAGVSEFRGLGIQVKDNAVGLKFKKMLGEGSYASSLIGRLVNENVFH